MDNSFHNDLAALFKTETSKKFLAGEVILSGEEPPGVFYIEKGFVQVYSISDSGDRYLHIIYKHSELFPLIWAIKNVRRRVFYEALTGVELRQMPRHKFLDLIRKNIKAASEIMRQLAEQFYVYADRLDNLEYKTAHERVVYRVLFLASRFGRRDRSRIIIEVPVTHELIAESINLTRETVSREIEKLEKQKLLSRRGGNIVIENLEELNKQFSQPISLDLWGLK